MKINLPGDQWLDPSTFRVMFQLDNKHYDSAGSIYVQPLSWNPVAFSGDARLSLVELLSKTLTILIVFH